MPRKMDAEKVLARAQQFFFLAMQQGYASGAASARSTCLPGAKEIRHINKNQRGMFRGFLLIDQWQTGATPEKSSGLTTISYHMMPIWVMHYGGEYHASATSFLRKALMRSYFDEKFVGGRGPRVLYEWSRRPSNLLYINDARHNEFTHFEGTERIVMESGSGGVELGHHHYRGWSLL